MDLALPATAYTISNDDSGTDGHYFGRPPGLSVDQWPRSRIHGAPMAHLFTVRVPTQYRCAGPDLVALSVFQADDADGDTVDGVAETINGQAPPEHDAADTPFWSALTRYALARHPQERHQEDGSGGGWAWIWLTEAEFGAEPGEVPALATRGPGHTPRSTADLGRADKPGRRVKIVARDGDPNVGKLYNEWGRGDSGYIPMRSEEGERLGLDRFWGEWHFGGTADSPNGHEAFGPFYLQFDEGLGKANLGGDGEARLDLAADTIDFSCG
jgi:hypothetical protein